MMQKPFPFFSAVMLLLFIFLFAPVTDLYAQMFSVREREQLGNRRLPLNNVMIGLEPASFDYQGDPGDPEARIFEFDGTLVRLRYDNPFIDFSLGFGGGLTGIDEVSYFDAALKFQRGIRVVRNESLNLRLPVQLKTSITSVSNDQQIGISTQFDQGTFSIGGGANADIRLARNLRISATAIPNIGFSFSTGGTFGGSIFDVELGSKFFIDRLFGQIGLSVGWEYSLKKFRVDEEKFDYDFDGHSILIGLTF